MFRGKHHVRYAVNRIRPGGINGQLVARGRGKINFGTGGTSDPVFLLRLDALRVINQVKVINQALGVSGNLQHPLGLNLADYFTAATFADAVDNLFVGENAFAGGTPVYGHLFFICEAVLEHLQKNPLGPLIILRVGCVNLARPVERKTQRLKLAFEPCHILFCDNGGVNVVFNRVVFAGKTERIPPDGVKHVVALHAAFARNDIHCRVRTGMADVQALPRWIWELNQRIILWFAGIVGSMESPRLFPAVLPLFFNLFRIVFHCHSPLFLDSESKAGAAHSLQQTGNVD